MKGKVGWWWNKIFMEIFRRHLTVVWIAKPFVFKSFVFSFFVPVWNWLLNLWLFFMSFVATSSYVIVSRPDVACRNLTLTEPQLYDKRMKVNHNKYFVTLWLYWTEEYYSQTRKTVWTPEIFLECYCVARNKPIACEKVNCKQEH